MTTLRQMRFLVALADTENFSRAAEICNVTQSTLSTGLKEMEARLGVKVAERSTHSVLMTSIGTTLAERAREILAKVTDFEAAAQAETSAGMTQLRLGVIPTVGPFLLPRALPGLRAAWPEMQIYLREELTESLLAGLTDGRLDVIIIALRHPVRTHWRTFRGSKDPISRGVVCCFLNAVTACKSTHCRVSRASRWKRTRPSPPPVCRHWSRWSRKALASPFCRTLQLMRG